jgi:stearoyl-CoA desaturase (delta-9 desaturase)
METQYKYIPELTKYPELQWLNKNYLVPPILFAALLLFLGGVSAFVWGFVVSTVVLYHGTFVINSLTHLFGHRRFVTTDDSRNSFILALITMGEGWHNNHHHYQHSERQGMYWWEIDMSYYILKAMSWLGLVWDLRVYPESVYEKAKHPQVTLEQPKALAA